MRNVVGPGFRIACKQVGATKLANGNYVMPSGKRVGELVSALNTILKASSDKRHKNPKIVQGYSLIHKTLSPVLLIIVFAQPLLPGENSLGGSASKAVQIDDDAKESPDIPAPEIEDEAETEGAEDSDTGGMKAGAITFAFPCHRLA